MLTNLIVKLFIFYLYKKKKFIIAKNSLTNGLRQCSNNNQILNKLNLNNDFSLNNYQKNFVDNVEESHKRVIMMRPSQVGPNLLGPTKNGYYYYFFSFYFFSLIFLAVNKIEVERMKNFSTGIVKDNTKFKSILPNFAKKRNYAESETKFKTSTFGSIYENQQSRILSNQQTLAKKFCPIIPRQLLNTQNGIFN